jgi:hypothetical protein
MFPINNIASSEEAIETFDNKKVFNVTNWQPEKGDVYAFIPLLKVGDRNIDDIQGTIFNVLMPKQMATINLLEFYEKGGMHRIVKLHDCTALKPAKK